MIRKHITLMTAEIASLPTLQLKPLALLPHSCTHPAVLATPPLAVAAAPLGQAPRCNGLLLNSNGHALVRSPFNCLLLSCSFVLPFWTTKNSVSPCLKWRNSNNTRIWLITNTTKFSWCKLTAKSSCEFIYLLLKEQLSYEIIKSQIASVV